MVGLRAVLLSWLLFVLLPVQAQHAVERPNIIFILSDDQPYGYMGVTGNKIVHTPNLDALAEEGVLFTNAHVSSTICTPSRVSLLLGQYERRHGVNFNSGTSVSEAAWKNAYPTKLREAGYYTGWIGKNHAPVGSNGYQDPLMENSFDYWYAGHGHLRFYPKEFHDIFSQAQEDTQLEIIDQGIQDFLSPEPRQLTKAKSLLSSRPVNKPFMLTVNLNLPHGAGTSTMQQRATDDELYKSAYRNIAIPLPEYYVAKKDISAAKLPAELLRVSDRQEIYDYVDKPDTLKERTIRQMQTMQGIDRLVGNLRRYLQALKLDKNTIIIFSSDHGLFMGQFGLGGKGLCYQQTSHVPLIIYDPREASATHRSNALVQSIDITSTILSLAKIDIPDSMQGRDLAPLLSVKPDSDWETGRDYLFIENLWSTHFGNPRCEAIQNKTFKYIRYYENSNSSAKDKKRIAREMNIPLGKMLYGVHDSDIATYQGYLSASIDGEPVVHEELFNLDTDPNEVNNLANLEKYDQQLSMLRQEWKKTIINAKGEGKPQVSRYTLDSQRENNH